MVQCLNQAALDHLKTVADAAHAALVPIFERSGLDPALTDVWIREICEQAEDECTGPVGRIRGR